MRFLIALLIVIGMFSAPAMADYKANYWASWASVTSVVTWTFPYKSREINLHNGSATQAICVAFNGATITTNCTSPVGFGNGNLDNKVFQLAAGQILLLQDFVTPSISIQSAGAAASPVSVVVTY